MAAKSEDKKHSQNAICVSQIHIIGSNKLQNELLALFLEKETGIACAYDEKFNQDTIEDNHLKDSCLLLYDLSGIDMSDLWSKILKDINQSQSECPIAFFNLAADAGNEKECMDHGIRGVFYSSESAGLIAKGVQAILNGEMWYSRKTMSEHILSPNKTIKSSNEAKALTTREKEILIGIAAGHSNDDIANELFISPHTVKTHIYNIYKKINISNRLQAMLWVAKYL